MLARRILLSGGGIRGLAHIGALQEMEQQGMLGFVKEWIGVSAGSILALMLVAGYTLKELKHFCEEFDFTHIVDLDDAPSMILNFGMDTGEKMKRLLEVLLKEKGYSPTITFEELKKQGAKDLRIFATDLHTAKYRIFSATLTPSYKVVDAVRASSSLPIYFQPVDDNDTGHVLIDGGIISNFPLLYMTSQEKEETIGLNLKKRVDPLEELDTIDYLYRPMTIGMRELCRLEESLFRRNCITIETKLSNPVAFNLSTQDKNELFEEGRRAVRSFLANFKPVRRWSVS